MNIHECDTTDSTTSILYRLSHYHLPLLLQLINKYIYSTMVLNDVHAEVDEFEPTSYGGVIETNNQRNSRFGGVIETNNQRSEQGFGGEIETNNQRREQGFGGVIETNNQRNSRFGGVNETDNQRRVRLEQGFGGEE